MAKRRKRRSSSSAPRRRRRGGGGGGMLGDLPVTEGIAAGAVGFIMQPNPEAGSISAQVQTQMNKLPALGNKAITGGLVLHYGNKFTLRNRWLKLGAKALLIGGMFSLGRGKFAQSQALLGEGDWESAMDADQISGVIDIEGDDD